MTLTKKFGSGFAVLAVAAGIAVAGAAPAQAVNWSGCDFVPAKVNDNIIGTTNYNCSGTQAVNQRFNSSNGQYVTYRSGWIGAYSSGYAEGYTGYLTGKGNAVNSSTNIYWF